jgi:hypothetical protein
MDAAHWPQVNRSLCEDHTLRIWILLLSLILLLFIFSAPWFAVHASLDETMISLSPSLWYISSWVLFFFLYACYPLCRSMHLST